MSRVAKAPVVVPAGVDVKINGQVITIKGKKMCIRDRIQSGVDAAIKPGNTLPMRNIPVGSTVHNVEMKPGKGLSLIHI